MVAIFCIRHLEAAQVVHVVEQQALSVDRPDLGCGLLDGGAVGDHRVTDLVGDADPGCSGSEDDRFLVAQRDSGDMTSAVDGGHHHGAGALDVVVEDAVVVAVGLQDRARVDRPEVLEVQDGMRKQPVGGFDVAADEGVVVVAAAPGMAVTQVERVLQELFVIGADIQ